MRYLLLGSYKDQGELYYCVLDTNTYGSDEFDKAEVLSLADCAILTKLNFAIHDQSGNPIRLEHGKIVGNFPDMTESLNEPDTFDEDVDGFWGAFEESEESEDLEDSEDTEGYDDEYSDSIEEDESFWGTAEDLEEDSYDDYETLEDEQEEFDDFLDLFDSFEDEDSSVIADYYRMWKSGSLDTSEMGKNQISAEKIAKDFSDLEESTESKLYSYLTDEEKKYLQEYYLHISKRIFNLERGVNDLPIRRKTDLDSIRATGDSWAYAGFIDMGYAGTSVCPFCHRSLSRNALSSCHKAPVVRIVRPSKAKKAKNAVPPPESTITPSVARTHNGVCSYPNCRRHCAVVTDDVGVRSLNRESQMGIICENCGNRIPQSSHYCTFNDPVRYMHVAWDVSVSDLDTNFYGQMVSQDLEDLINSNNCIKFGLTCTAEFFDIAKNSEAFKALENVQNVCKKDMELLQAEYEKGDIHKQHIMSKFTILDSIVRDLLVLSTKVQLLKGEELLPTRLLTLYQNMRKTGMIIPKSFIQFVRDFLVDWDTHKFIDRSKNFPHLYNSVGSLAGTKTGKSSSKSCYERVNLVLSGVVGRKSNAMQAILLRQSTNYRLSAYGGKERFEVGMVLYMTAFFVYKLCGHYEYDAINQGDEGGKDSDKGGYGKHAQELKYFYQRLRRALPDDIEYSRDYLVKLCEAADLVEKLTECFNFNFITRVIIKNSRTEEYEIKVISPDDADYNDSRRRSYAFAFKHYDDQLVGVLEDNITNVYTTFPNMTLTNWLATYNTLLGYLQTVIAAFPAFEEDYINKEATRLNEKVIKRKEASTSAEVNTPVEVETIESATKFLLEADLENLDPVYDFAKSIVGTLRKSQKQPTLRQWEFIKPLYEHLVGHTFTGKGLDVPDEKTSLKAVKWVLNHSDAVDKFTYDVCKTINNTGKISPKQMRFVEKAIQAYKNA